MDAFLSFLNGFIYTALLFFLCLIFTVGTKWLYIVIKARFFTKRPAPPEIESKKETKPPEKKPTKKPVRTIEINTDDVDKIYFKKSS